MRRMRRREKTEIPDSEVEMALAKTGAPKADAIYVVLAGGARRALPGARALSRVNPHAMIEVTLKLRRKRKLPELNGRPPKIISRAELAAKYGATEADVKKVSNVFAKWGLKTEYANPATRTVRLSGTMGAVEDAFLVKLFNYSHPDGNYRGRVGNVNVPKELQGIVLGVFGLDNRRVARRRRQVVSHTKPAPLPPASPSAWYRPAQLASHYDYPKGDGAGQCIGLLEFGGGFFPSDLQLFCQMANTSVPTVKPISTDGTSTSAKDGAEGEVMLDIEVVGGVCPRSTIAVYFAQWTEQGWITALDAAVHDQANDPGVISCSWGSPEDTDIWTQQAMDQINETLMEAAQIGVTVCIAAGDDGSSDADMDGRAHADFPSSSPYVLSVGGTTIPKVGGNGPDIGWFEGDGLRAHNGGSTGGGVSSIFPRPTWQSAITIKSVNPGAIVGRVIPDIAANADWNASPYLLVVDGQPQPNGGTSAATPLVASLLNLINAAKPAGQRVGYVTPVLYQPQNGSGPAVGSIGCTDVVTGSNKTAHAGGYTAGPGYDADSGWGTPIGVKLADLL